jgi:hypothetical protein
MHPRFPSFTIFRLLALSSMLLSPLVADAQSSQGEEQERDPRTTTKVAFLAVADLPSDQRAVVYLRPKAEPSVVVVTRSHLGSSADLAAGYEAALKVVRSRHMANANFSEGTPLMRIVLGPSDVPALSDAQRKAFDTYRGYLKNAASKRLDGIGEGHFMYISKRGSQR